MAWQLYVVVVFSLSLASVNCIPILEDVAAWLKALSNKGLEVIEDDIIMQKEYVTNIKTKGKIDMRKKKITSEEGKAEAITAPLFMRWRNARVPYVIDKSIGDWLWLTPRKHILNAIKRWEAATCIKFVPRTTETDYVHFISSKMGRCASHIGRTGGRQYVYLGLGCRSEGTILHEIGHSLGFFHEQSRPDRDRYIKINWDNINSKYHGNFQKYESGISNQNTPYDYDSIMHYSKTAFVKTWKSIFFQKSISVLTKGKSIGQREKLSYWDKKEMNLYYQCPPKRNT